MPIDYSKWDKIEISDDSDIEVHPNVDKKSFIKWKQRDIHEKRAQRNIEIKSILVQLTMYAKLNTRVEYLTEQLKPEQFLENDVVMKTLDAKFDPKEKFNYEELIKEKGDTLRKGLKDLHFEPEETENTPCYNEMIEDLLIQIKDDHPDAKTDGFKLVEYLKEHRAKIDDVMSKQTIKLDDLLYQRAQLIVSDDLHTGFDRSFMNKDKGDEDDDDDDGQKGKRNVKDQNKPTKKETVTTSETVNTSSRSLGNAAPSAVSASSASSASSVPSAPSQSSYSSTTAQVSTGEKSEADILDELELKPETEKFGKLPTTSLSDSADFLIKHTKICTEQQKDALMMSAFDAQLEGNTTRLKQIVHQALILQYIVQLKGSNTSRDDTIRAIKLFFSKFQSEEKMQAFFNEEFTNTVNHIIQRCKIIKQEQEERAAAANTEGDGNDEEALIQLRALDENTTLSVNIPEEGTQEYEIFKTKLSVEFQRAIMTQSLDEVNKEFAKLKVEDAEKILEIFNECGAIGVSGYLEDEQEFEELKKEYNEQEHADHFTKTGDAISNVSEQQTDTNDIVD